MHLLQNFVPPCLGGEERCYHGSNVLRSPFYCCCCAAHFLPPTPRFWLCWRTGLLPASLTNIQWASHSWEELKRDIFLLIFAPTLEEANASVTPVCEDSGAFCICDPIQVAEEPTTLRLEICPEVERYNPLLGDVSVMEKQAGHLHVKGFKIGGTPGKLHTLKFSEASSIFSSECRVNSGRCKAKELYFGNTLGMKVISAMILLT